MNAPNAPYVATQGKVQGIRLSCTWAVLAMMLTLAGAAGAEVIAVDWGSMNYLKAGSYAGTQRGATTENQTADYGGDAGINDWRRYVPYSDTAPFNPSPTAYPGYHDDYTSGVFYGGFNVIRYDGGSVSVYVGVNSTSAMQFRYVSLTGGGTGAGMAFWKKEDFLNGADAFAQATLTDATSLGINISAINAGTTFQLIVQDGTDWYISNASASAAGLFTIADPTTETWATFNPANANNLLTDVGGSYTLRTFDDVQALGFYFSGTVSGGDLSPAVRDVEFEVDAVPEPTTMALLGMGSIGISVLRLRCRRSR